MSPLPESVLLTRREALRRAALVLGAALTPSIFEGALHAQPAPTGGTARPEHLDATQFAVVAAAAERILPRTDTPGAIDVGVPAYIDRMVGGYLTAEDRTFLLEGLTDLERRSQRAHRKGFAALTAAEQDALLKTVARESQDAKRSFFHVLRELTITGYFTSEPVGKNVLNYDPVPGRWEACLPLSETGNRSYTR